MIERPRDKRRARREARASDAPIERPPKHCEETDHKYEAGDYGVCKRCGGEAPLRRVAISQELVSSIRLLLRHAISGSVPPVELQRQLIRIDTLMGNEWVERDEFRRHGSPRGAKGST